MGGWREGVFVGVLDGFACQKIISLTYKTIYLADKITPSANAPQIRAIYTLISPRSSFCCATKSPSMHTPTLPSATKPFICQFAHYLRQRNVSFDTQNDPFWPFGFPRNMRKPVFTDVSRLCGQKGRSGIGTSTTQKFKDTPVVTSEYYNYRVPPRLRNQVLRMVKRRRLLRDVILCLSEPGAIATGFFLKPGFSMISGFFFFANNGMLPEWVYRLQFRTDAKRADRPELFIRYQVPSDGRKTAMSALPSPSKSPTVGMSSERPNWKAV